MTYTISFTFFILSFVLAIMLYYFICKNEDLENELVDTIEHSVYTDEKLSEIEFILKNSEQVKENYFITLDKINRVIFPLQTDR